jgi:nitroreductase
MSFFELVKSNRSCRRFDQSFQLSTKVIRELVDLARMSASAGNMQPLKYITSADVKKNEEIFSCLKWAAYLEDWKGPKESEKPSGYVIILGDKKVSKNFWCDHGIAAQTILLGARNTDLAGCIFGAINRPGLQKILDIGEEFEILLVVALGKPVEKAELETLGTDGDIKYYRDNDLVHHVPKRALDEIIIASY